jgi:hypothetical protein
MRRKNVFVSSQGFLLCVIVFEEKRWIGMERNCRLIVAARVARFFLVQNTKTEKYTNLPQNKPYDLKIYQHLPFPIPSKIYPNLDFCFINIYHLATLVAVEVRRREKNGAKFKFDFLRRKKRNGTPLHL